MKKTRKFTGVAAIALLVATAFPAMASAEELAPPNTNETDLTTESQLSMMEAEDVDEPLNEPESSDLPSSDFIVEPVEGGFNLRLSEEGAERARELGMPEEAVQRLWIGTYCFNSWNIQKVGLMLEWMLQVDCDKVPDPQYIPYFIQAELQSRSIPSAIWTTEVGPMNGWHAWGTVASFFQQETCPSVQWRHYRIWFSINFGGVSTPKVDTPEYFVPCTV